MTRDYDTLQTLSIFLEVLRHRRSLPNKRPRTPRAMSELFGVHENSVRRWETPETTTLSYEILELYQDFFGMPAGMMVCLAQIATMVCSGQREEMENVAYFLNQVSARLLEGKENLSDQLRPHDAAGNEARVLGRLLDWTKDIPNYERRVEKLLNYERLQRYADAKVSGSSDEKLRLRRMQHGRDCHKSSAPSTDPPKTE